MSKLENASRSFQSYHEEVEEAVKKFLTSTVSLDTSSSNPSQPLTVKEKDNALDLFAYGINRWSLDIHGNRLYSLAHKKRLREEMQSNFFFYDDLFLKDMFDVVAVTSKEETDLNYLNDWRPLLERMNCIIIQQGDPDRQITVPSWLKYQLYSKREIERDLGPENAWMFGFNSDADDDLSAMNFGLLVADRDFVFLLHPSVRPKFVDEKGAMDFLRAHANNLLKPSVLTYYQEDTDPYHHESDFVRGTPYSLREGFVTALSYGSVDLVSQDKERDAISTLLKATLDPLHTTRSSKLRGSERRANNELQSTVESVTIAKGVMFSLSLRNVAINRRVIGSIFYLLHSLSQKTGYEVGSTYYNILKGWILKAVLDNMNLGVKHFDASSFLTLSKSAASSVKSFEQDMRRDVLWQEKAEDIIRCLSNRVELSLSDRERKKGFSLGSKYEDVLNQLKDVFSETPFWQDFHHQLMSMHRKWSEWHYHFNDFRTRLNPVVKQSDITPTTDHQCASLGLVRNESTLLDVWLRYNNRHFGSDVFVLCHYFDSVDYNLLYPGIDGMRKRGYHFHDLNIFDDNGFPLFFQIQSVDLYHRRLLRLGFKCVIFSDIDEIIIADPERFPQGLRQYLSHFVFNVSHVESYRAIGKMIAHIYETENGHSAKDSDIIEKDIDWSKPLLSQRSYWGSIPQYNKPVLTTVPTRRKPGFHNFYYPAKVEVDNSLYLLHLREIDHDFCMEREAQKAEVARQGPQSQIDGLLSVHLIYYDKRKASGELCQYGQSVYLKKQSRALDNTGRIRLDKMEEKWKGVIV